MEKDRLDYPFYDGRPQWIDKKGWAIIFAFIFAGFLYLSLVNLSFLPRAVNFMMTALSLPVLSFLGYYLVVRKNYSALFKKVTGKDLLFVLLLTIAGVLVGILSSNVVQFFGFQTASNPDTVHQGGQRALEAFLLSRFENVFQLFGEEFLGILPFLALLQLGVQRFHWAKRWAVVFALVVSSLIFGLFHLPTYNWNLVQCLVMIGSARIVLTLAYMKTKNLWISYFVHFLYDTLLFSLGFLL